MEQPIIRDISGCRLLSGEDRWRTQRVVVGIPVTLQATIAGQMLTVLGVTTSVNDRGAILQCSRHLGVGTQMEMQNNRTGQRQACRVMNTPVENQHSYLFLVEFEAPAPGFWHISFPPKDWKPSDD
jgi:hypothetical protein